MSKRVFVVAGAIAGLIVLIGVVGAGWLVHAINSHLVPPPDPAGQQSIATYEGKAPSTPPNAKPLLAPFSWDSLAQPPKSAYPWTRWWWPGGDVDAATLIKQLHELDDAHFGGAEIQPFLSGAMAVEDEAAMARVYAFDKPAYYTALRSLLGAADERGWQIDLTHFSGWPPGGPEINLEDSLTDLVYGEATVSGGRTIDVKLPRPKPGVGEMIFSMIEFAGADFINFPADHARVLSVMAVRKSSGEHAWNPYNLNDTVQLDADSVRIITDKVKDGRLVWHAPTGEWQIIVSYVMPSGEVPMGAAQKPQGFVVDHLRKPQVLGHYEYAFGERTGLPEFYGKGLRGFFNDSLEFRLKRMGVEDILKEFNARRGYNLEPWLPVIYLDGIDNVYLREILGVHAAPEFRMTDLDERIRRDYQQTLSDLVIERFVETSAQWAAERGLTSRAQSYGMDIDILQALGANTIPETEQLWAGGSDLGLKMASSAAALYGRPLVSSESFVWINRDYTTTARKIKAAADKLLLAGVNHIVYHGTPYPWRGSEPSPFGEEGWMPFSGPKNPAHFSSHIGPGNTSLWPDIPSLNTYIARCQNLLRQGTPSVDVLIYYPFLGFHGANPEGGSSEALLSGAMSDADPRQTPREDPTLAGARRQLDRVLSVPPPHENERETWTRQLLPLVAELDRRGISWGWVNDHALQSGKVGDRVLTASGGRYASILVPNVRVVQQETLRRLGQLAAGKTPVVFAGDLPVEQPGFRDAAKGDAEVKDLVQEALGQGAMHVDFDAPSLADMLQKLLQEDEQQAVRYRNTSTIKMYRRQLGDGDILFFANQSAKADKVALQLQLPQPLWWFDAQSGTTWPASMKNGVVDLELDGFESRFLIAGVPQPPAIEKRIGDGVAFAASDRRWTLDNWTFALKDHAEQGALFDWRDRPPLVHAKGPGIYRTDFVLAQKSGARYLLNLGLVQGSALVVVNGKSIGRDSMPPFIIDISQALQEGKNTIEIQLLAPLRNYFVGRALAKDPEYLQMDRYADQLVAAGLIGPVVLAESVAAGSNNNQESAE
jgi:hypothetical protein